MASVPLVHHISVTASSNKRQSLSAITRQPLLYLSVSKANNGDIDTNDQLSPSVMIAYVIEKASYEAGMCL